MIIRTVLTRLEDGRAALTTVGFDEATGTYADGGRRVSLDERVNGKLVSDYPLGSTLIEQRELKSPLGA